MVHCDGAPVSAAQHNGLESTAGTPDSRSTLISPQERRRRPVDQMALGRMTAIELQNALSR